MTHFLPLLRAGPAFVMGVMMCLQPGFLFGQSSPPCAAPPDGLVAWWRGEASALDSAGANPGTLQGDVRFVAGRVGNAFAFSGGKDDVMIPFSGDFSVNQFTCEAWIQPAAFGGDPTNQALVFGQSGNAQLLVRPGTNGLKVAFGFWDGASSSFLEVVSTGEIPVGEFSHVAGSWDRQTLVLFLNGQLDNQVTPGSSPAGSSLPFFIGGFNDGSTPLVGQFFTGVIDEVSFYNRALRADEVGAIFNAGSAGKCLPAQPLQISPPALRLATAQTLLFTASGGAPPYSFAFAANNSGASITATGLYSSGPTQGVTDVVRVTDSQTTGVEAAVFVAAPLASLPAPPALQVDHVAQRELLLTFAPSPINSGTPPIFPTYQLQMSENFTEWSSYGDPVRGGVGVNLSTQTMSVPLVGVNRFFRLQSTLALSFADLSRQDLSGAYLVGANLQRANLTGANLAGADLSGADLTGADLDGSILDGANLAGAKLDKFNGEFVLHGLSAPTGQPASVSIPNIMFNPRPEDYALVDAANPDERTSHNTVALSFKAVVTVAEANEILRSIAGRIVGGVKGRAGIDSGVLIVRLPTAAHEELSGVLAALNSNPRVYAAVRDALHQNQVIPPDYSSGAAAPNWAWRDLNIVNLVGGNWGHVFSRIPQMWNLNQAVAKQTPHYTKVAALEKGFRLDHEDLPITDFSMLPTQILPNDRGHGTMVGGVIAAVFDNRLGTEGVDPFVTFIPAAPAQAANSFAWEQAAISFAVRHGVEVVNISQGYPGTAQPTDALKARRDAGGSEVAAFLASFAKPPLIVCAAGNDSSTRIGDMAARYHSEWANAGARSLVDNILVVEAIEDRIGSFDRAPFSDIGGNLSAPGDGITLLTYVPTNITILYETAGGTSFAAPYVAGVASYLLELDPDLTASQLRALIVSNARPVTGASPGLDAFAAALAIDSLRGNSNVLHKLLDIDDGTLDGNQRTNPNRADVTEEDADHDGGLGDGRINMADFRRWRDWLLEAEGSSNLRLDGSANHPKKDLNGDGLMDEYDGLFPRGDFNGDGQIDRTSKAPVPGFLGNARLTDLEVLMALFDDPDYQASELPGLVDSCDILLEGGVFLLNPAVQEVVSAVFITGTDTPVRTFTHTRSTPDFVYTLPLADYTVKAEAHDAAGNVVGSDQLQVIPGLGEDLRFTPGLTVDGVTFRSLYTKFIASAGGFLVEGTGDGDGAARNVKQWVDRSPPAVVKEHSAPPAGLPAFTDTASIPTGWATMNAQSTATAVVIGNRLYEFSVQCSGSLPGAEYRVIRGDPLQPGYYTYFFTHQSSFSESATCAFAISGRVNLNASALNTGTGSSLGGQLAGPGGITPLDPNAPNLGLPTQLGVGGYTLDIAIFGQDQAPHPPAQPVAEVSSRTTAAGGAVSCLITFSAAGP